MLTSASIRRLLRRKRIVVCVIALATLFMLYQLINIVQLTSSVTEMERARIHGKALPLHLRTEISPYDADDDLTALLGDKTLTDGLGQKVGPNSLNSLRKPSKIKLKNKKMGKIVFGVSKYNYKFYEEKSNEFTCVNSGEKIPFDQVNDDYCDCEDGSDEPSTNACPNSRFFCIVKTFSGKDSVSSSLVNDGICDCCDGSDEWLNVTYSHSGSPIRFSPLSHQNAIHLTPCIWRCF